MGIEGIRGEKSSAGQRADVADEQRVEVGQVRESVGAAERVRILGQSDTMWRIGVRGSEIVATTRAVNEHWPVLVGVVTDHVELREWRDSLDGKERVHVIERIEDAAACWRILFSTPRAGMESGTEEMVLRRWPVVVAEAPAQFRKVRPEVGQVRWHPDRKARAVVVSGDDVAGFRVRFVGGTGATTHHGADEIMSHWPIAVSRFAVEEEQTRESIDGKQRVLVADKFNGVMPWRLVDITEGSDRRGKDWMCSTERVMECWPVVVETRHDKSATDQPSHVPTAPPPHDDANPHARHALCQLLDRIGSDGVTQWLNSVGVTALQNEIYAFMRETEARAQQPLEAKIARLEALAKAEAARADAWMDFADALHKDDNARLATAGIAVSTATLAVREAAKS